MRIIDIILLLIKTYYVVHTYTKYIHMHMHMHTHMLYEICGPNVATVLIVVDASLSVAAAVEATVYRLSASFSTLERLLRQR